MKGTYVTQFNLFVPGKKGLEQPGAHFSAPYLGLSLCLSLSNTQMHTHVHTHAHTRPTQRWQWYSPAGPAGWRVPWNLFWSLG